MRYGLSLLSSFTTASLGSKKKHRCVIASEYVLDVMSLERKDTTRERIHLHGVRMCLPAAGLKLPVCSANVCHGRTMADAYDAQHFSICVQGCQNTLLGRSFFLKH